MSRLWDLVIGGGIVVCLLALVACAVDRYVAKLNAHIDRQVGRYMRGAGELAP